eukprot:7658520-Alexandrium_andersonii.AAC.1
MKSFRTTKVDAGGALAAVSVSGPPGIASRGLATALAAACALRRALRPEWPGPSALRGTRGPWAKSLRLPTASS